MLQIDTDADLNWVEAWGRGIEKIETASQEAGRPLPVFEVTFTEVTVTFPFPATSTTLTPSPVVDVVGGVVDGVESQAKAVLSAVAQGDDNRRPDRQRRSLV
ncbi:MAG: hypothetical protein LBK95_16285 [Bifidobacteriaceae bacterium]|nr:hypothetical protein [Bifidobacteriaceae bacterium]